MANIDGIFPENFLKAFEHVLMELEDSDNPPDSMWAIATKITIHGQVDTRLFLNDGVFITEEECNLHITKNNYKNAFAKSIPVNRMSGYHDIIMFLKYLDGRLQMSQMVVRNFMLSTIDNLLDAGLSGPQVLNDLSHQLGCNSYDLKILLGDDFYDKLNSFVSDKDNFD